MFGLLLKHLEFPNVTLHSLMTQVSRSHEIAKGHSWAPGSALVTDNDFAHF